jgi:hypothetical protein
MKGLVFVLMALILVTFCLGGLCSANAGNANGETNILNLFLILGTVVGIFFIVMFKTSRKSQDSALPSSVVKDEKLVVHKKQTAETRKSKYVLDDAIKSLMENSADKNMVIDKFKEIFSDTQYEQKWRHLQQIQQDQNGEIILQELESRKELLKNDVREYWKRESVGSGLGCNKGGSGRCACGSEFHFSWHEHAFPEAFYDACPDCKTIYVTID